MVPNSSHMDPFCTCKVAWHVGTLCWNCWRSKCSPHTCLGGSRVFRACIWADHDVITWYGTVNIVVLLVHVLWFTSLAQRDSSSSPCNSLALTCAPGRCHLSAYWWTLPRESLRRAPWVRRDWWGCERACRGSVVRTKCVHLICISFDRCQSCLSEKWSV